MLARMTGMLYDELAPWWPLVSAPAEYAEEAALYIERLRAAAGGPVREVLELGSGGGNNALHMKRELALTLVEPSAGMRAHSVALNPECTHVAGDMRTVRLRRTFDAVFVHDAVMYMTTEIDLRAAIETIAAHLAPGGVALVAVDATAECFAPRTEHGGHDDPATGRGVRYLIWDLPARPGETTYESHFSFLLHEPGEPVRAVHDVHRHGVFPRATWLRLFEEAGLAARIEPRTFDGVDYDTFVAVRVAPAT